MEQEDTLAERQTEMKAASEPHRQNIRLRNWQAGSGVADEQPGADVMWTIRKAGKVTCWLPSLKQLD